jgi:hypothetical protein
MEERLHSGEIKDQDGENDRKCVRAGFQIPGEKVRPLFLKNLMRKRGVGEI